MFCKLRKAIVCFVVVLAGYAVTIHELNGKQPSTTQISGHINHVLCLYSCPVGSDSTNFLVDHEIYLLSSNRENFLIGLPIE